MEKSDVVVIGSGFFGVTTALLLARQGIAVTLISSDKTLVSSLSVSLNTLWPSLNDPPTRALVAHGQEVASYLQDFCAHGVDLFESLFSSLPYVLRVPCARVGMQDFEQKELQKACELGFGLKTTKQPQIFEESQTAICITNPERFQEDLTSQLLLAGVHVAFHKVTEISESLSGCCVKTQSGLSFQCELIVLANGLSIPSFFPKYKEILIPMSDVITEYQWSSEKKLPHSFFRAFNGHVGVSLWSRENIGNKGTLKVTGPRFLLPGAGVGLSLQETDLANNVKQNISQFHKHVFHMLALQNGEENPSNFLKFVTFEQRTMQVKIDCHPCDELPLIGEFGKLGKVLGCAGFLATGFSAGVWAGHIVSELIVQQKSNALHKRLKPRRFFKELGG
jgi:hypothetical protein